MRKIREVLRLKWQLGRSHREIEVSCSMGHGTVCELLRRAKGLSWEQVEALDDAELEQTAVSTAAWEKGGEGDPRLVAGVPGAQEAESDVVAAVGGVPGGVS